MPRRPSPLVVVLSSLLACLTSSPAVAQPPQLAVSPSEVPSGGAVTATLVGMPGTYWALIGSSRDNGFVYGGTALAVGTDVQILATGVFGPTSTASVPFTPPLGSGVDVYFVQAVSSISPDFIPLVPTAGVALRPRGFYTNAPTFQAGLNAGGARVTNVATPVGAADAATKAYVDVTAALLGPTARQSSSSGGALIDIEQTGSGDLLSLNTNSVSVPGATSLVNAQQFRFMADGGFVARGRLDVGRIPATGAGARTMWYPAKAAFRTGSVDGTQWDLANVGYQSFAGGLDSVASGPQSFAFGERATATGQLAVAFGAGGDANGYASFLSGVGNVTSAYGAVAMGAFSAARGWESMALGRNVGACNDNAIAIGYRATSDPAQVGVTDEPCSGTRVGFRGVLLFGDRSTTTNLRASADNQVSMRAAGGYRFFTNAAMTLGVGLSADDTSWNVLSDRNAKYAFQPVDEQDVLRRLMTLPLSSYLYKGGNGLRSIGPMAQDFHAAFGLGADDTHIRMNDIDGVALASLKALGTQVQQLRDENATLKAALEALAAQVAALTASRR